jgi:hypothetical protein
MSDDNVMGVEEAVEKMTPPKEIKPKKKPAKQTRRTKAEVMELVERINQRIAKGEAATSAAESEGLNYQTFKRYATKKPSKKSGGTFDEISQAVDEYRIAAERLRKLGFNVPVVKIDVTVKI